MAASPVLLCQRTRRQTSRRSPLLLCTCPLSSSSSSAQTPLSSPALSHHVRRYRCTCLFAPRRVFGCSELTQLKQGSWRRTGASLCPYGERSRLQAVNCQRTVLCCLLGGPLSDSVQLAQGFHAAVPLLGLQHSLLFPPHRTTSAPLRTQSYARSHGCVESLSLSRECTHLLF